MRLWGPQEGESAKAFSAFETYRDLGPSRTLREAAGIHYGRENPSQGQYDTLRRWSRQHAWAERVEHYDQWLRMERHDAVAEHVRAQAEDHAKRESRLREKALEAREQAMERTLLMLKSPLYEQRRSIEDGPSGEEITLVMVPAKWSLSTAVNLYNLSQNNAGLTAEEIEATGELDFSNLSEDEMMHLIELQDKIEVRPPER